MNRLKKLATLTLALTLSLSLVSCGEKPAATDGYRVGIIQLMDHAALNSAREGFIAALADNGLKDGDGITLDFKDGNGDTSNMATIADQFVADKKDLVLAIATPAAQAIAAKTTEIPILATAITSFEGAGLVESDEVPGTNVSGVSDLNPVKEQLELLLRLAPDAKTVGFLYNSAEDNSRLQIEIAKGVLDEMGIGYTERTVSNQNEVQQATASIIPECQAIYLPTDNVFASTMPAVNELTVQAGIPVVAGERGPVEGGALATYGITYYKIGYQTGLMAVEILTKDADISKMPVSVSTEYDYCVNGTVAEALGLEVPEDLKEFVIIPEG